MSIRLARARRPSPRPRVCALALFALTTAGCSQSLFDSNPDDSRDAGQTDGGGGGADASPEPEVDAAPVATCPAPCVGDAFADFSGTQGGENGRWNYLVDVGAPNGAGYADLGFVGWNGLDGWSAGEQGPAIAICSDQNPDACAGLSDFILLVAGPAGGQHPTLSFRVPETATYQLSGAIRVADGEALDIPIQLIVSRAGRHDAITASEIRTSESEVALAAVVPGLEGDEIMITIGSDQEAPPLGLRVFFTRVDAGADAFPGTCQIAARFDPDDPLTDGCRAVAIQDLNDEIGPPGTSTVGAGPSDRLGEARVFAEGQYLAVGNSPLDYTGDFTVQFWARLDEPLPFTASAYADWNNAVPGGINIAVDADLAFAYSCYMVNGTGPDDSVCLTGDRPMDGEWHFWRTVRSTADNSLALCIDGVESVRAVIPGSANLTSDEAPRLARNVVYNPAYFTGAIDEVRVFSEALPCTIALP